MSKTVDSAATFVNFKIKNGKLSRRRRKPAIGKRIAFQAKANN